MAYLNGCRLIGGGNEYQPGRKGEYAKNFLEGFRGLLECDGYTGYNQVENVTLVCCLAHCRRYFFEAIPAARRRSIKLLDVNSPEEIPQEAADPERAKEQQLLPSEIGLCYCNLLFRIERNLKDLEPEERKERRLKQEVPVWDAFWEWLGTVSPPGGSRLEKAVKLCQQPPEAAGQLPVGRKMRDIKQPGGTVREGVWDREKKFPVSHQCKGSESKHGHLQHGRDSESKPSERVPISVYTVVVHAGLQRQDRRRGSDDAMG